MENKWSYDTVILYTALFGQSKTKLIIVPSYGTYRGFYGSVYSRPISINFLHHNFLSNYQSTIEPRCNS